MKLKGYMTKLLTVASLSLVLVTLQSSKAFNTDGISDIVYRSVGADQVGAWWMQQTRWFRSSNSVPMIGPFDFNPRAAGATWHVVATTDFNRDGEPDLLWRDYSSGQTAIWTMKGTNLVYANTVPSDIATVDPTVWTVAGVGDIDHDGY